MDLFDLAKSVQTPNVNLINTGIIPQTIPNPVPQNISSGPTTKQWMKTLLVIAVLIIIAIIIYFYIVSIENNED